MSDHLKRLRAAVEKVRGTSRWAQVSGDDLSDFIADCEEMREALSGLEDACVSVASWSEECVDYSAPARVTARAVLAKAGGK
jgi:hypothetical protein